MTGANWSRFLTTKYVMPQRSRHRSSLSAISSTVPMSA